MADEKPVLTIVIPVYNEKDNITIAVDAICQKVQAPFSIFIVYDREEDTTLPAARKLIAAGKPVSLLKNKYGKGALNAIKTGLEEAATKYVIVTMADLSDPPEVMNDMLALAEKENAAVVCASRYMKGGKQLGGPVIKGLLSRLAGLSLYYLAGVPTHDATNSYKLYRTSFLREVTIESNGGFELGIELVTKAFSRGETIKETPTVWRDRTAGESHFKVVEWLPHYLKWYFLAYKAKYLGWRAKQ